MRKIIMLMVSLAFISISISLCYPENESTDRQKTKIRIAYPTATLINGQIGQVLLRTNILDNRNLISEVTGFLYGPPMMEALVSNKVDIAFTSEVPATLALAQGHKATIIATLGSLGRGAIMVLQDSPIKDIKDLRGKKVGVPFGSSPHRNLLRMLESAGLTPGKDVDILNIGRDEVAPVLLKGGVDAIMIWDPAVEQYIRNNKFRIVEAKDYFSAVIMNNEFIEKNLDGAVNFLIALREAILFMATHKDEVNKWFGEVSRLDPQIIDFCSNFNFNYRNVKKISDMNIALSDDFLRAMKESAEFTFTQKMAPVVDILKAINTQLQKEANKKLNDTAYESTKVIITNN